MVSPSSTQRAPGMEGSENRASLLRSPSAASDNTIRSVYTAVPPVNPLPAYVARHAAVELISSEIEISVFVTNSALKLVNEFLDQVLFNILVSSRSTSLNSLKIAVPTVLKPRLGKAAVRVAEEELKEYLNDEEESELRARTTPGQFKHDFDPDLAWKLARLRCMVYTRLGDLEEEDEEEWLEREGLLLQIQRVRETSQASIETGPASAIFLTSVMEYLGEQALFYASQHALRRHGHDRIPEPDETEFADAVPNPDDIIITGKDMNHVGRDSPLSRLWRSYRRNTRESTSRPITPEVRGPPYGLGLSHGRDRSSVTSNDVIPEERSPDQIPLPMSNDDIDEIEVPGLAPAFSDEEYEGEDEADLLPERRRPASMTDIPGISGVDPALLDIDAPVLPRRNPLRSTYGLQRSFSSPVSMSDKAGASRKDSATRLEAAARRNIKVPESENDPAQESASSDRQSLTPAERPASTTDSVLGGVAPSIAGALGTGMLGIPGDTSTAPEATTASEQAPSAEPVSLPKPEPKFTVAEEMMGRKRAVPPPSDAQTGSSITNVSDFASMHLPVGVSSMPSVGPASPMTPWREVGSELEDETASDKDYTLSEAPETPRPVPLQAAYRSGTLSTERNLPSTPLGELTAPAHEPVAPASTKAYRPITPDYEPSGMGVPSIVPSGFVNESSQIRHLKADSRGSNKPPHSRESSANSRILGLYRDPVIPPQVVTQQRAGRPSSDEAQSITSTSGPSGSRDFRSDSGTSSAGKRVPGKPLLIGDDVDEAKKKSLEILIRGNETLHYTLTPAAALRDDGAPQKTRTQTQDMADFLRNTGPPGQDAQTRTRLVGLGNSPPDVPLSPRRTVQPGGASTSPRLGDVPVSPTRPKNPLGEPRDPRTEQTIGMREIADYARSTGPLDAQQLPQPISPTIASSTSPRPVGTTQRPEAPARETSSSNTKKPANRLKYQARDARASRNEETAELIDFIREGPPSGSRELIRGARGHRIDRKVAPFRSTMDSEDFDNLVQGRPIASSIRDSEDGHQSVSIEPSVSSQTPLILPNGQSGRGTMATPTPKHSALDSNYVPQRTRRRLKDPYAIDDSDDEGYEDEYSLRQTKNQEESLIDFLRNTAPPPEMMTQPALSDRTDRRSPVLPMMMMGTAREISPHLTQSGSKRDVYRPTQPTHAAHIDRNRANPTSSRNGSKPRFEARDAKAIRTNTSELAEYLKSSGPAADAEYRPQPFILASNTSASPKLAQSKIQTPVTKDDKNPFKRFSRAKR